ncbi:hypothetical protein GZ998_05440 [Actinomyces sp. 594]|nr:hypothetical protein [Actinomyces sp. 594]
MAPGREVDVRAHLEELEWPLWLAVTEDRPWVRGSASARHNGLCCELALRAGAWLGVPGVLGECLASADDLFGAGAGRARIESGRRGDALLVREDGVRLVVELTASATPALSAKAESWARLLAANPGAGVMVVFVVAAPVDGAESGASLFGAVRQAVGRAVRTHPGGLADPTGPRMAVVDWRSWFPARGMVDMAAFGGMRAQTPVAVGGWADVDLLTAPVAGGEVSVLSATGLLGGVPWWLRRDDLDPMGPPMRRFGARIGTNTGRGVARVADYPLRLRTPAALVRHGV